MWTFLTSARRLLSSSSSMSSSWFSWTRAAMAALPLAVWANDSLFSLCRVRGSSMEPTLLHGDVVVVRKSDGFWQKWTRNVAAGRAGRNGDEDGDGGAGASAAPPDADDELWMAERRRAAQYERDHCGTGGARGLLLDRPPVPLRGTIVVFRDPQAYPSSWSIKRVVGLGGQRVRVPVGRTGPDQKSGTVPSPRRDGPWSGDGTVVVTRAVPPYSLWVEGDNARISVDSRHQDHGPVSKKLLVGIAEYRVWPPWRMGKLGTSKVETPSRTGGDREGVDLRGGRPRPRSFWPDQA